MNAHLIFDLVRRDPGFRSQQGSRRENPMGWSLEPSPPPPDPLKENRLKDWAIFHMSLER